MKAKTSIVIVVLVVLFIAPFLFLCAKVPIQVKRMQTRDRMGQIYIALSRTPVTKPLDEYNPVAETLKLFPTLPMTHGQIADAWGNPIRISIKREKQGFSVHLASAGPDGLRSTTDDIVEQYLLTDEKW